MNAPSIDMTVPESAQEKRLDQFLAEYHPEFSRSQWQKTITQGQIYVNDQTVKPSHRLTAGELITGSEPEPISDQLIPQPMDLNFLYEDEVIAVVDKPANLIVHPGKANYSGTLANALKHHMNDLSTAGGDHRPGIVHRLDRDTTGVILIAKTNQAHELLSKQFEERTVRKEYRAIVWGQVEFDADYIETYLRPHSRSREKMIVCGPDPQARQASTYYEVIERFREMTYLRLLPKTGRTHQLRVHLQHLQHPIIADRLYGGRPSVKLSDVMESTEHLEEDPVLISRQALHAFRLKFEHPQTKQALEFESPLPEDLSSTLQALQTHSSLK